MNGVSTVLAGARGFKRHPLAPDPHPRSVRGMNVSYDYWKSSVTFGRENGGRSAEWELIVLSALASVGLVEHEPDLGGTTRVDFRFADESGWHIIGDITTLSDDEAKRRNPIDALTRELSRRVNEYGVRGSFSVRVSASLSRVSGGAENVSLLIPPPHEFSRFVFNNHFDDFLGRISAAPTKTHVYTLNEPNAKLTIVYTPDQWRTTSVTHADYRAPRDIVRNPLYNRLKKKSDQVRKCWHKEEEGLRAVIVCDGGSWIFRPAVGAGTFSLERIARHFLRKPRTLDCVVAVGINSNERRWTDDQGVYCFDVKVFARDAGVERMLASLLSRALRTLPKPVRTPINARYQIEGQKEKGLTALTFRDRTDWAYSAGSIELSARAVADYIAQRIDPSTFMKLAGSPVLETLKQVLDTGGLVTDIDFVQYPQADDDKVIIRWREKDVAVAPFESPGADD